MIKYDDLLQLQYYNKRIKELNRDIKKKKISVEYAEQEIIIVKEELNELYQKIVINNIQQKMYNRIIEKRDINKIDKIVSALKEGLIFENTFYDVIRKFTKNVYSDHSINRWECLSDYFYTLIFN